MRALSTIFQLEILQGNVERPFHISGIVPSLRPTISVSGPLPRPRPPCVDSPVLNSQLRRDEKLFAWDSALLDCFANLLLIYVRVGTVDMPVTQFQGQFDGLLHHGVAVLTMKGPKSDHRHSCAIVEGERRWKTHGEIVPGNNAAGRRAVVLGGE